MPDRVAVVINAKGWYITYWARIFIQFFFLIVQVALQLSRDFVVYFEEYSSCGGRVIDEFMLQHDAVEVTHGPYQDFC